MSGAVTPIAEWCAAAIEILGIVVLTAAAAYVLAAAALGVLRRSPPEKVYQTVRQRLGRGILLGLELLIAADIIHTVAVELTFQTVSVLAVIVLIRTFLSFTLEVELTGSWPWQGSSGSRSDSRPR